MATPMNIEKLPDNLVLEILSYLPVKERCISGRVCRRWRKIVQDNSLWRHVDLLPYQIELRKLWKLIRAHLSCKLRTLRLRGVIDKKSHGMKPPVSEAMMKELVTRCTALSWLHIQSGDLTPLPSADVFPATLTHLTLRSCTWQPRFLKNSVSHFPNLLYLDLGHTVRVDNHDLMDIAHFSKLAKLKLDGCYRVGEQGLQKIAESLTGLRVLNLQECQSTDLALHHVGRHLTSLTDLDLSESYQLTESCIPSLVLLKSLETLSLTCYEKLLPKSLAALKVFSGLKTLRLSRHWQYNSEVGFENEVSALKDVLPITCSVVVVKGKRNPEEEAACDAQ